MSPLIKQISTFSLAVAIGFAAFGLLWLPKALAVTCPTNGCGTPTATMCYQGSTIAGVTNVYPSCYQYRYMQGGGICTGCVVSGN